MGLFSWLGVLLFFFNLLCSLSSPLSPPTPLLPHPLCHPYQSSALLAFKNSFPFINDTSYCYDSNANSSVSWDIGRDCCTWSGVTCDDITGHVIGLHLHCSGLRGVINSNNSLFSLSHLQTLILSANDFEGSAISPEFGGFAGLVHLDLSSSNFAGQVPPELACLSNLATLDLSSNQNLRGDSFSWNRIIKNLTSLQELSLWHVNMSDVLPNSFMNLSISLTSLYLWNSGLKGEFPENIFHLPNLQELDLSYNLNLTGSFPQYNWTSPLKSLGLSSTGFLIDLPFLTQNLKYLNALYVAHCNFRGSFPAMLYNLTHITSLSISDNNFGGKFPWDSLNLEKLTFLDLSDNNFIGPLFEVCSNSTKKKILCDSSNDYQLVGPILLNLKYLYLSRNNLNGTIPSWLYSLPHLEYLSLAQNQITGQIGEFQYNSLTDLDLSSNKLYGIVPTSIFQQVNLSFLELSSNSLSDVVTLEQISKLKNLYYLSLSFNNLSLSSISHNNYSLPNLQFLHMSSCNIREFPYSLRSFENLIYLDLSNNRLEGSVPQWLWNVGKDSLSFLNISYNFLTHIGPIPWKTLHYIDLRSNQLQGHLPIPPPSTLVFFASNNQLTGDIPTLVCKLVWIEVLDLSNNNLSGNIPPCIGNFSSSLSVLDLRMNKFSGIFPAAFAKGNSLTTLNLNGNLLEGPLPQSIHNCESLEVLDVGNNKLNGSFPHWLESLPELQVLILRSNRFHGAITNPKVKFPFQKLRIMDVSNNMFIGALPAKYMESFVAMVNAHTDALVYMGKKNVSISRYYHDSTTVVMKGIYIKLKKIQLMLIFIDFSRNNFTGEIPELIGKLSSLKGLNFSHNKLTGLIPTSLGNLSNLEWLDLSANELDGMIPWQLEAYLNQLEFLNLSQNKLEGPIPTGNQFNTFGKDSYGGNLGLCGFPLSKSCSNDESQDEGEDDDGEEEHNNSMLDLKVVMMGYASGVVIGISIGYMVFFSKSFDYWLMRRFGGQWLQHRTNVRMRGRRRN